MMAGIHLDVQLYDDVSEHLSERSLAGAKCMKYDCLIMLLSLHKKILKVFHACGGGRGFTILSYWSVQFCGFHVDPFWNFREKVGPL